jgi:glycosyltransferase involved in cell wall biosynthesis
MQDKVKIVLSTFNRSDLLPIQIECIQKRFKNNYEIIVLHDSRNNEYVSEFETICRDLNISFYHHDSIPGKNPSQYHGEAIQWIYDTVIKNDSECDLFLILDHDMFLIRDFDLIEHMGDYHICGNYQSRGLVSYIWPGLIMFRNSKIKNHNFNFLPGVYHGELLDTGGGTHLLINSLDIKYKQTSYCYPDTYNDIDLLDPNVNLGYGFELHLNDKFLHFRNACGWHNNMQKDPNDDNKKRVLEYILKDYSPNGQE